MHTDLLIHSFTEPLLCAGCSAGTKGREVTTTATFPSRGELETSDREGSSAKKRRASCTLELAPNQEHLCRAAGKRALFRPAGTCGPGCWDT